jgi:hypothetical protein
MEVPTEYSQVCCMIEDKRVAWILRLMKIGAEGVEQDTDVMEINLPHDLGDLAHLGLTLTEAKLLLAGVQREIVGQQVRGDAIRPPEVLQPPTVRQSRSQTRTRSMSKKPPSPLPPGGDEDPVWGDLFGSVHRLAASSSSAAETPTSAPRPKRTPAPKVRKLATKPKR